jgi:hypothetical protein
VGVVRQGPLPHDQYGRTPDAAAKVLGVRRLTMFRGLKAAIPRGPCPTGATSSAMIEPEFGRARQSRLGRGEAALHHPPHACITST